MILEFLKKGRSGMPKYIKDIWYNTSVWTGKDKFPIVFDDKGRYIDCEIGLKIIMGKTKNNENIYYEVIKLWKSGGGDFRYDSDAIHCTLKFSHTGVKYV